MPSLKNKNNIYELRTYEVQQVLKKPPKKFLAWGNVLILAVMILGITTLAICRFSYILRGDYVLVNKVLVDSNKFYNVSIKTRIQVSASELVSIGDVALVIPYDIKGIQKDSIKITSKCTKQGVLWLSGKTKNSAVINSYFGNIEIKIQNQTFIKKLFYKVK